jgi:hypothetical protein
MTVRDLQGTILDFFGMLIEKMRSQIHIGVLSFAMGVHNARAIQPDVHLERNCPDQKLTKADRIFGDRPKQIWPREGRWSWMNKPLPPGQAWLQDRDGLQSLKVASWRGRGQLNFDPSV